MRDQAFARLASIVSQIFAATSGPPNRAMARMPVGEVTLISVRLPSITSMPTNSSPRSRSLGPSVVHISRSRLDNSVACAAPPRTMFERRASAAGTRLTAPANSPSTRMMRLSPCLTSGRKRWITQGSLKVTENMSNSEPKFMSCGITRNTAAPPWPCSGFITTAPCSSRNALISSRSREIKVGGIRCGKSITKIFSGALRTLAGLFTTSVLGWIRSRKCVEVMEARSNGGACRHSTASKRAKRAQRKMIADLVAHRQHLHRGDQFLAAQRQLVGGVIGNPVAALLRLEQQREGGTAADVDTRDGVHLDGDIQFHG